MGALDHPSAGQDFKAIGGVGEYDDLDGPVPDGFQRIAQLGVCLTTVRKDMAQHGVARGDSFQHIRRAVTILTLGAVDLKPDEQSGRVDDDLALVPLDPLSVVFMLCAYLSRS